MPKGVVICLPPGAGKTRKVWEDLLRGVSRKPHLWRNRIKKTLILTPNRSVHRIWLRELLILAIKRRIIFLNEDPKTMKIGRLKKILREELTLPHLDTFKCLKAKKIRRYNYLILDEWHRLPQYVVNKCREWVDHGTANGWFLGGSYVKQKIYFVSATPVNPVLEDEIRGDKIIDRPYENEEPKITEALEKAKNIIKGFMGKKKKIDNKPFFRFLEYLGIKYIAAGSRLNGHLHWKYPDPLLPNLPKKVPYMLIKYLFQEEKSE